VDRHRFDLASLLAGLLFLNFAVIYITGGLSLQEFLPLKVLGPGLFIGLGVIGLVRVLTRSGRRDP
jgi:hypothetical protein